MATIPGTANNDELFAENTGDLLQGLAGDDILDAAGGTGDNTLSGGVGNDELFAGTNDLLQGDEGDDTLEGRSGSGGNTLEGGEGEDLLFAGSDDVLIGGEGSDRLFAGSGDATLTGGAGNDQFWLATAEFPSSGNVITDFDSNEDILGIAGLEPDLTEFDDLDITQENGATIISFDNLELATLENFTGQLTADDFVFGNEEPNEENNPPEIEDASFFISPDAAEGTIIGTVIATDPDNDELTYEITQNTDPDADGENTFAIDSDTGQITLSDPGDLSINPNSNFELKVTATDPEGASDTATVTITTSTAPQPSNAIILTPIGTYATGIFDEGAAEIVAYDPETENLFVVNANSATVDIINISDPSNPNSNPLEEAQEVSTVPDTSATGDVIATINENNILKVTGTYSNLSSDLFFVGGEDGLGNAESAIHIHLGEAGTNGPIVFNLDIEDNEDGSGKFSGEFTLTNEQVELFENGGYYVNLHTENNQSGELRSQLTQFSIDVTSFGAVANSVAVQNGIVAIAVEAEEKTEPGTVVFFDTDGNFLNSVTVGALPDMLTFNPTGTRVLVANEGEPNDDYTIDPEGSVSIIDISGGIENLTQADVITADFSGFNDQKQALINKGVRIFGPNATVAQDLEPEYITVSEDGSTAYVSLQENNALAVIEVGSGEVIDILPLGYKDYSKGQPSLSIFAFDNLPTLGTTLDGEVIDLSGFSGLYYLGEDNEGNLEFITVGDRGPDAGTQDVDNDGQDERIFLLPDYQPRVVQFTLDRDTEAITITDQIFLTREDGTTPITGLPNIPGVDEIPADLDGNLLDYDAFGADFEGILLDPSGNYWLVDEYRPAIYQFDANGVLLNRYIPEGTTSGDEISEVFVFGDSLSDTGNLADYLTSIGGEVPATYTNGRISNGPIWIDTLAAELNIPDEDITNYAVAGATTGRISTNFTDGTPNLEYGLLDQIDDFVAEVGTGADPEALYLMWIGANDILGLPFNPTIDPEVAITQSVDNIENAIATLTANGAENIILALTPNTGRLPFAAQNNLTSELEQLAIAFNTELTAEFADTPEVTLIDLFTPIENVAANPEAFGFSNITDPLFFTENPTSPPEEYFFWDNVHFTTQGHAVYADIFQETVTSLGFADYGSETLPAEYANRRENRGFEAVAFDTDDEILYAFIQTPLANSDRATSDTSQVIRILGIDPTNGNPVAEYVYLLEDSQFRPGGRVDKIGDAVYAGDDTFFVIERDAEFSETAKKFIFETNFNNATNVLGSEFFVSELTGSQEVDPVTTDATGTAILSLNEAGNALEYSITVSGLDFGNLLGIDPQTADTGDDVTMLHFHNAVRGANGGVVFGIISPNQDDDDLSLTLNADGSTTISGVWEETDTANQPLSDFLADLQNADAGEDVPLYLNVHTNEFPGGEIRGQIVGGTLEQLTPDDLSELGVNPVNKVKVTNLPSLGYLPSDKPEGLALLPDGTLAVLNDNDFGQEAGTEAIELGLISFPLGNTLDVSDADGEINLANYPIFGMLQPDAIDTFEIGGQTYIISANEGDARDYDGFSEEARVADLVLDPEAFPNAEQLQQDEVLGRLQVTTELGDLDGDGDYDELYAFGGRSFSIFDEFGNLVFDSGDDFEQIIAEQLPEFFNSDNDDNDSFDSRSDAKGPEPEGVVTGEIGDRTFAFIGLERVGGIMVYEVTDPQQPEFVQYLNNRNFSVDAEAANAGDLGPEGLVFIPAEDSPNGEPLLVVANEVSGTTTIYEITVDGEGNQPPVITETSFTVAENSAAGTVVGTVTATDSDANDPLSYAITDGNLDSDGDGINAFAIDSETGEITVADADELDFETTPNFALEVTVTDAAGLSDTGEINVNLTNVVEPVTLNSPSENNIFSFAGDAGEINLELTVNGDAGFVNEVGLYFVDDAEGTINGILPGEEGYLEAAIASSQTIASLLSNNSKDFFNGEIFSEDQSRILSLDSDQSFGFYLVQNSSIDDVANALAAGTTPAEVFFGAIADSDSFLRLEELIEGTFELSWDDVPDGGDNDFDDVQVSFAITNEEVPLGSNLQGNFDLIDLSELAGELVIADIVASQDAALNNRGGLYIVQDTSGTVLDPITGEAISPDEAGYSAAAIANSVVEFDRFDPEALTLPGGFLFAPYLLAGGSEDAAYFGFAEANPDGIDHVRLLDDNTFGFEDISGGGDFSYNDFVFAVDLSVVV
ncbi:MAG: choice-of-anchor I family protein [Oscillatoria sp. PMC 1068.18]|nr:choice-of-anchor I family protein [Oscillatoria sp. PMC 1076.18]MEC4991026.1 choice-of-anchor I family protein [Oscillatoria sp. PMC 1068.18]